MMVKQKNTIVKVIFQAILLLTLINANQAFPVNQDVDPEDQYISLEPQQLARWIMSQLRKEDYISSPSDIAVGPLRIPQTEKRNSAELTSSIMAIPRTIIDNGRK